MSESNNNNEEIQRLSALIDQSFEKLATYNRALRPDDPPTDDLTEHEFSNSSFTTTNSTRSASFISLMPIWKSKNLKSSESTLSMPTTVGSKRRNDEDRPTQSLNLRRRYTHHFASLEAFFTIYMTKLEQKYVVDSPFATADQATQTNLLAEFNAYSYTVLKVDGFYWNVGSLRRHMYVKKSGGGRWFLEGIERMQSIAMDYISKYDEIIKPAPQDAVRAVLMPAKKRETLPYGKRKKKWSVKKMLENAFGD